MQTEDCIRAYRKHKNLKLAAEEIKIPWQTLYVRLRKAGEPVSGDKARFGSSKDRFSCKAESEFRRLVPSAMDNNADKWQSKHDFNVFDVKVDVKAARPKSFSKYTSIKRWAFSFKKQSMSCDFMCCFCYEENEEDYKILLVPSEMFRGLQSVSVSSTGRSKWLDFEIGADSLSDTLEQMAGIGCK
jgi:hypothetical protein